MKQTGGYWFPDDDDVQPIAALAEVERLPEYIAHAKGCEMIVQAGGNVGVFPQALATHFRDVFTFEPDPENYACLERNVKAENVTHLRAALSDDCQPMRCTFPIRRNYGAIQTERGGDVRALTIDSLRLRHLDYIMLDVEGWEFPVLQGARATLEYLRPVVSAELKGVGDSRGMPERQAREFLESLGYREVDRIGKDSVFSC